MGSSKKLFNILMGLLVLLVVGLLAGVYGANVILSGKSGELTDLKAAKLAAERQEKQLNQAKEDIEKYSELNEIAKTIVPQDKDQARAVSQIVKLAAESGIPRLSSVAFPPSTLGGTGAGAPKGLTQVTPVQGMGGVYKLQITVTQSEEDAVTYDNFITFLSKLENNRRTAQVSSINVQPDAEQPDRVSFTLVIDEFIKP